MPSLAAAKGGKPIAPYSFLQLTGPHAVRTSVAPASAAMSPTPSPPPNSPLPLPAPLLDPAGSQHLLAQPSAAAAEVAPSRFGDLEDRGMLGIVEADVVEVEIGGVLAADLCAFIFVGDAFGSLEVGQGGSFSPSGEMGEVPHREWSKLALRV
jgi:hypothetical protein